MKIQRSLVMITASLALAACMVPGAVAWAQGSKKIRPVRAPYQPKANLIVKKVSFHTVQRTTNWQGKPCAIFNILPEISNSGMKNAGNFRVQLWWKKNGIWVKIPQKSYWDVHGLAAGQTLKLTPRQYNNCDTSPLNFKVEVDSNHQVTESNESDNTKKATFPSIGHHPPVVFTPPQGWSPPR